jgi:transcriptional regulator with XRE-family HTH domain
MESDLRQKIVGNFLKSARERAGLTQQEVALRMRYSTPQFVSNWERGLALPPLDALPRIVRVLRIKPKSLIDALHRYQDENLKVRKREVSEIFRRRLSRKVSEWNREN